MHYKQFHIKILKIIPTCFDPKIILKELHSSLLKPHNKKKFYNDFSKEQRSSLRMILGSKRVAAILSVLMWNFV